MRRPEKAEGRLEDIGSRVVAVVTRYRVYGGEIFSKWCFEGVLLAQMKSVMGEFESGWCCWGWWERL
jgi:hypothetical protein